MIIHEKVYRKLVLLPIVSIAFVITGCSKDWIFREPSEEAKLEFKQESHRIASLVKGALFVDGPPNPHYIITTSEYNTAGYVLVKNAESGVNFLKYLGFDPRVDTSSSFNWTAPFGIYGYRITFSGPVKPSVVGSILILVDDFSLEIDLVTEKYLENFSPEQTKDLQYFPF